MRWMPGSGYIQITRRIAIKQRVSVTAECAQRTHVDEGGVRLVAYVQDTSLYASHRRGRVATWDTTCCGPRARCRYIWSEIRGDRSMFSSLLCRRRRRPLRLITQALYRTPIVWWKVYDEPLHDQIVNENDHDTAK